MIQRPNYFKNLDALRTIAFLLVFFEHTTWRFFDQTSISSYPFFNTLKNSIFENGELGVSVFFTLSGFLITYLIFIEKEETEKFNIWAFYLRRILRIWPLYYAYVFFAFVIYPFLHKIAGLPYSNPSDPLMQVMFLSNFDSINIHQLGPIDNLVSGITWSLSIEEQFYLCWPLLFLLVPRKILPFSFISILLFSVYFRFLHHTETSFIYFHTFSVFGDLVIGGLGAYMILYNSKTRQVISGLGNNSRSMIYFSGILYLLFKDNYLEHEYSCVYSRALASFFIIFVILDQNFNQNKKLKLERFDFLSKCGKYTYGLYLLHPIAIWIVQLLFSHFNIENNWASGLIFFTISLIIAYIIAYVSYNYYERHFLKLKDKFSYINIRRNQGSERNSSST